jgi:hypothetical protein
MKRAENMFWRRRIFSPLWVILGLVKFSYDFLWLLAGQPVNFYPYSIVNCSGTTNQIDTKFAGFVKGGQVC